MRPLLMLMVMNPMMAMGLMRGQHEMPFRGRGHRCGHCGHTTVGRGLGGWFGGARLVRVEGDGLLPGLR